MHIAIWRVALFSCCWALAGCGGAGARLDEAQVARLHEVVAAPHRIDAATAEVILDASEHPPGHVLIVDPLTAELLSFPVISHEAGAKAIRLSGGALVTLADDWRESCEVRLPASLFDSATTSHPLAHTATQTPMPQAPKSQTLPPANARDTPARMATTDSTATSANTSFTEPDQVIPLPGEVTAVAPAGHGRLLLLSIPSSRQIVVFDMSTATLGPTIDTDSQDFLVAGGATRCVVVDRPTRSIARYRLDDGREEQRMVATVVDNEINAVAMGMSSEGPLYFLARSRADASIRPGNNIARGYRRRMIDLDTLSYRSIVSAASGQAGHGVSASICLDASADGGMLLHGGRDGSSSVYRVENGLIESIPMHRRYSSKSGPRIPSELVNPRIAPDGNSFYVRASRFPLLGDELEAAFADDSVNACRSLRGDVWCTLKLPGGGPAAVAEIGFHVGVEPRPVATLRMSAAPGVFYVPPQLALKPTSDPYEVISRAESGLLSRDQVVQYAPQYDRLVVVARQPGRLFVKNFDIEQAIAEANFDLLTVTSHAPLWYSPGKPVEYAIETATNGPPPTFGLLRAPFGVEVSEFGLLTWAKPTATPDWHSFAVYVRDDREREIDHPIILTPKRARPKVEDFPPLAPPARLEPPINLTLTSGVGRVDVGGRGAYLLAYLPDARQLAVVDTGGRKAVKVIDVEGEPLFAAGADQFVVYEPARNRLARWSFARLEEELVVHPDETYSAMALGSASNGPLLAFVPTADAEPGAAAPRAIDLQTLLPADIPLAELSPMPTQVQASNVAAAAQGDMWAYWHDRGSRFLALKGNQWTGGNVASSNSRPSLSGNGTMVLVGREALRVNPRRSPLPAQFLNPRNEIRSERVGIFAETLNLALSWPTTNDDHPNQLTVALHTVEDGAAIVTLPDLIWPPRTPSGTTPQVAPRHWLWLPVSDALVEWQTGSAEIAVWDLPLDRLLASTGKDYLFVASLPPISITAGQRLSYPIDARSHEQPVTFRLVKGPSGMRVSDAGQVEWASNDRVSGLQRVEVEIRQPSGRTQLHAFDVQVHPAPARRRQ